MLSGAVEGMGKERGDPGTTCFFLEWRPGALSSATLCLMTHRGPMLTLADLPSEPCPVPWLHFRKQDRRGLREKALESGR